jgi:hypothetical protein
MSTLSTLGEKEIVIGTVTAMYQPGWSANGKLTPGKLVLDTDEGVCEVSFMQLYEDSVRTEKMPQIWNDIDEDEIRGRRVAISATFQRVYTNDETKVSKHQYGNPSSIKYLDGDAPTPKEATPEPTGERASTPPNTAILKPLDPNGRDVMIVDQVIFKGAVALRVGGAEVEKAVADAIAVWHGVRARHFVTQETDDEAQNPDLESLESF